MEINKILNLFYMGPRKPYYTYTIPTIAFILIGIIALLVTRPAKPALDLVSGSYYGSCCSPITIQGRKIAFGKYSTTFQLEITKIGLVANLDAPLGRFYQKNILQRGSSNPVTLAFNDIRNPTGFIIVDYRNTEYKFVRSPTSVTGDADFRRSPKREAGQ